MRSRSSRKKIVLATSNPGKLREIRRCLGRLPAEFLSLQDIGADEDVEEKGKTFLENARLKSLAYSSLTEYPTLAEDSGLEVEYLNGAPGVLSARFSDPGATDERNIQKVLRLLQGVAWRDRRARFVCRLVLSQKGRILKEYRGQVRGYIALEKSGNFGFGYDPIFFYGPFGRTFGQVPREKKNAVSHRGRALKKMKLHLLRFLASADGQT
ncbi:MAG: RdgB/HAM1 family non-canonical purine NTP pyrophosphatase [Candidatus Aminicenantales bacterium]